MEKKKDLFIYKIYNGIKQSKTIHTDFTFFNTDRMFPWSVFRLIPKMSNKGKTGAVQVTALDEWKTLNLKKKKMEKELGGRKLFFFFFSFENLSNITFPSHEFLEIPE